MELTTILQFSLGRTSTKCVDYLRPKPTDYKSHPKNISTNIHWKERVSREQSNTLVSISWEFYTELLTRKKKL